MTNYKYYKINVIYCNSGSPHIINPGDKLQILQLKIVRFGINQTHTSDTEAANATKVNAIIPP